MLKRLAKLILPKRRLRPAVANGALRGRLERLEDRAMLSANGGASTYSGGMYDFGPLNLKFERHDSAVVGNPMQAGSDYGPWLQSNRGISSASPGGFDTPRIGWGPNRVNSNSQVGAWVPVNGIFALQPTGWKLIGLEYAWQPFQNLPQVTQSKSSTTTSGGYNSGTTNKPANGGGPLPVFDELPVSNVGGRRPLAATSDVPADPRNDINYGQSPIMTSTTSIPTAAQILSRPADSIAFMTSGAVDSALQSYATQLLLTTTNVADQLTSLTGDNALYLDGDASDYITFKNDSRVDGEMNGNDIVESERQAVDAVLSELHDFSKLPTEPWNNLQAMDRTADAIGMIEMNVSDVWSAALADAEGGMVMLANTGDANESAFDLAGVAATGSDLLHVHAGVEAAVGLYQTMDVGTDEVPVVNLPNVRSAAEPSRDIPGENRFSNEGEKASSNKAAATIAATFVGALLLANRKARAKNKQDDDLAG